MKISQIASSRKVLREFTRIMDGDRICITLVADSPRFMERYATLLIRDLHNLFHIVVNPPDSMTVNDLVTGEETALCTMDLKDQWQYIQNQYVQHPFNLIELYKWFDDCIIIPERTAAGNIHMHYLARLSESRLDTDIPKLFWRMFNINITSPSNAGALKRFKETTKYMVNVEPVRDGGIIDYLFHKDKKDYESIMNIKTCGGYRFHPLYLHSFNHDDDTSKDVDLHSAIIRMKQPEKTL